MIYLCGGFKNNWQQVVIDAAPNGRFFNPRDHKEVTNPKDYTKINKDGLDQCNIVFAYLEKDNPSPMNVPLECGYMLGKGGRVIFCNEWSVGDEERSWFKQRFIDMFITIVTYHTTDLNEGINKLNEWINHDV